MRVKHSQKLNPRRGSSALVPAQSTISLCLMAVFLCMIGLVASAAEPEKVSLIERQLEQMQALDQKLTDSDPERDSVRNHGVTEFYRTRFASYQAPEKLADTSDGDLIALMRAAQTAAYYSHDDAILDDAMVDLSLIEKRGKASAADFGETYRLLIGNRRFDEAQKFLDKHPALHETPPPTLLDLRPDWRGASEMRIGDRKTLVWMPVDLEKVPRILVIGHPLCHFTQNAARAIEADPKLKALFAQQSKWLAPQDGTTDFDLFRQWNAQHPGEQMTIAYRAADFPQIDNWATPTFYFIDRGRVVSRVTGWPKGGRRDELLAAYRKAFPSSQSGSAR